MNKSFRRYKNIRLKNYDYHNGWFFITNKTNNSQYLLKDVLYETVKRHLLELSYKTNNVSLDSFVIMQNHIHAILVFNNASLTLSEFWRRFKAITTVMLKQKRLITESLWQRNFYEHVIRNEQALNKIRDYIKENPYKADIPIDKIYDDIKMR